MTHDEAFFRDILVQPDDDTPRLVYADRLESTAMSAGSTCAWSALKALPGADRRGEKLHERLRELQGIPDPCRIDAVLAGRVVLAYHHRTFALLKEGPVRSKADSRAIERWEREHGTKPPAAVREWCSLEGSQERLSGCEDGDFERPSLKEALSLLSRRRRAGAGP
jgi:uncharacterized protein (TIGR02996 family)